MCDQKETKLEVRDVASDIWCGFLDLFINILLNLSSNQANHVFYISILLSRSVFGSNP